MTHLEQRGRGRGVVPSAILALIGLYAVTLMLGWPQSATRQIVADQSHHGGAPDTSEEPHAQPSKLAPPYWTVIPFAVLLVSVAVLPLLPAVSIWWHANRNRFLVAMIPSAVTLAYYAFFQRTALEGHWPAHHVLQPNDGVVQIDFVKAILASAILQEFLPFIVLLFSLFTISGGIRISGDLQARPLTNTTFLAVGTLLASFVGTTGAAMLLIRPLLETNRERRHVAHTVVFFIFTVCNCGGCLLPIGDPPLFLGYLEGVPFTWTLTLWKEWLFVNGFLLLLYFLLDAVCYYRRETTTNIDRDIRQKRALHISGWQLNAPLLLGVVLAVAFLDPSKPIPGTHWHSWIYLREIVQLGLVAISIAFGSCEIRSSNRFNYHAIVEVAAIFSGIFITMQPALQILNVHGSELGLRTPAQFFWATGGLSGVLDNAPTYLVFFQAARVMPQSSGTTLVAGVEQITLIGISLGAVFMGAMTYIGNGPNFMVRAITEESGVKMPTFFGYMVYSCLILLPVLAVMMLLKPLFPY
jgi:Na+/H+ antiporter NhaD/arsenite permease-like protein